MRQFCLRKDNQLSKETIWCWSGLTWRGNPSCRCLRSECSCRTRSTRSPSARISMWDVEMQNYRLWLCDFVMWRYKIQVVTLWLCDVKIQKNMFGGCDMKIQKYMLWLCDFVMWKYKNTGRFLIIGPLSSEPIWNNVNQTTRAPVL